VIQEIEIFLTQAVPAGLPECLALLEQGEELLSAVQSENSSNPRGTKGG